MARSNLWTCLAEERWGQLVRTEILSYYDHAKPDAVSQGKTNIDFVEYWGDMSKWTFGHPAIQSLGNGRVLLAYYAGVTKCLRIHWVRVKIDEVAAGARAQPAGSAADHSIISATGPLIASAQIS